MLPFMKDAEPGAGPQTDPSGLDATIGAEPCDYLTVAGRDQHVRHTTTFVVVMLLLGGVSLGLMVKKSRPSAAQASGTDVEEASIEAAIGRLTGVGSEMVHRMDDILTKFAEFTTVEQVDVGELHKNPFALEPLLGNTDEVVVEDSVADRTVLLRQAMLKQVETLELLSIMNAVDGFRCVIGDRICAVGDRVNGFEVVQVRDGQVALRWLAPGEDLQDVDRESLGVVLKLSE